MPSIRDKELSQLLEGFNRDYDQYKTSGTGPLTNISLPVSKVDLSIQSLQESIQGLREYVDESIQSLKELNDSSRKNVSQTIKVVESSSELIQLKSKINELETKLNYNTTTQSELNDSSRNLVVTDSFIDQIVKVKSDLDEFKSSINNKISEVIQSSRSKEFDSSDERMVVSENERSEHGQTHTSSDLVPLATRTTPGLASPQLIKEVEELKNKVYSVVGRIGLSITDINNAIGSHEQLFDHDLIATTSSSLTSHIADGTLHFTEGSIDHTAIQNIGSNSHSVIDTHIADGTLHFTEGSIDHTAIQNIGSNSHSVIDTHIADVTIHMSDSHDHSGGDGAQIDHGGLAGLTDDDHSQYALLAGRAGTNDFTGNITATGSVGIGTDNPSQALELATGNIKLKSPTFADATGRIQIGSTEINTFNYGNNGTVTTNGSNIFIGALSGNFTMGSTATQTYQSSLNTGLGYLTLNKLTTGFENLAIGSEALRSNQNGSGNVGIGRYALYNLNSGSNNVGIGKFSLRFYAAHNTTAIGYQAGAYLNDGSSPNTGGGDSLYIGANTKTQGASTSNETVIGYGALGSGSNTVSIGGSTVTGNYFNGTLKNTLNAATQVGLTIKGAASQSEDYLRVIDSAEAEVFSVEADGDVVTTGTVQAAGYKSSDGSTGATGSFTAQSGETITVKNGLITSIV
jgi:hypothetical protein